MKYNLQLNNDKELVDTIQVKLRQNGGFCPCRVDKIEDNECMCKEFREQLKTIQPGEVIECHCGLFLATGKE